MGNHLRRIDVNLFSAGVWDKVVVNVDSPLTQGEIENLEIFLKLLDASDEIQRLSKADGLRQLGRFSDSLRLLEKPPSGPMTAAHKVIENLAQSSDSMVAKIE